MISKSIDLGLEKDGTIRREEGRQDVRYQRGDGVDGVAREEDGERGGRVDSGDGACSVAVSFATLTQVVKLRVVPFTPISSGIPTCIPLHSTGS